jgi:hypothetical protein
MIRTFDDATILFDDANVTFDGLYFGGTATTQVFVYFTSGIPTEVSSYVRSVNVRRGRSRELDTFTSGACIVTLNNEERLFDPLYTVGPFYGRLSPRLRVQVVSDTVSLFDGFIEDWNLTYDLSGKQDAEIVCVDGLALLAQTTLDTFTNTTDTPGARLTAVISRPEIAYSGVTDFDGGFVVLQQDVVPDATNTLSYLQKITETDQGRLFVDGNGVLQYRDRAFGVISAVRVVFGSQGDPLVDQLGLLSESVLWFDAADPRTLVVGDSAQSALVLQDAVLWFDAAEPDYVAPLVPFTDVKVEYGSEFLYNRVTITRNDGVAQVAKDNASESKYGIRALAKSDVLFINDAESLEFAAFLAALYAEPQVRVASHEVILDGLDDVRQRFVKRLEIGDVVRTVWSPFSSTPGVDLLSVVEGVEHQVFTDRHVARFQLTPFTGGGFILDDINRGLLDTSEMTY